MDSFYDAPRRPPAPIPRERLTAVPMVPEISIICPPNPCSNDYNSYNQWKQQTTTNKENFQPQSAPNSSILKKVRFEGPPPQQRVLSTNQYSKPMSNFEQMYMANIPSRQLDLSVIDLPPTTQSKSVLAERVMMNATADELKRKPEAPTTYKQFLEASKPLINDSVTDIYNYKPARTDEFKKGKALDAEKTEGNQFGSPKSHNGVEEPRKTYLNSSRSDAFHIEASRSRRAEEFRGEFLDRPRTDPIDSNYARADNFIRFRTDESDKYLQSTNQFRREESPRFIAPSPLPNQYCNSPKSQDRNVCPETQNPCKCSHQTNEIQVKKDDDDCSIKDLLKIIAQQNQMIAQQNTQLITLQQQVSELVLMHKNPVIESKQCDVEPQKVDDLNNQQQRHLKNFSIGLTTSFEVSFRPHHGKNHVGLLDDLKAQQLEPLKIQEITETDSNSDLRFQGLDDPKSTLVGDSMVFGEPIRVREDCPSPEPSIKIDMNDFDDSDSDQDYSEVRTTLYNNLVGQVNQILHKAQIETAQDFGHNNRGNLNKRTMQKVKETTLKHLKKIGVNVSHYDDTSEDISGEVDDNSYCQDDISFAVKQLLMKYLPSDYLAKAATNDNDRVVAPKKGAIKNRPEFSFASVQYMKKYNLMANNPKEFPQPTPMEGGPKILDITKLKQQPKLI